MVSILNAYLVAQLLLRPWRRAARYGWWLIGISSLLVVIFQSGMEPLAMASVSCFAGWFLVALASLFLATPWLIDKRGAEVTPDFQPLWVWLLLNFWLAAGNLAHQQWTAVVLSLVCNVLIVASAISRRT